MELRHLRYFVAVAEEASFTRAAERLWIAQPGLSTQIRRLEGELGLQLFERHSRGAVLTPAGALLLERARTTLEAAAAVEELGRDLGAGRSGSLRLGLCACGSWSGTAPLLERFTRESPGIELTVIEAYGGMLVRDVRDRRLDAALVAAPFATPELLACPLGADPMVVAVPRGHRLDGEGPLAAGEIAGESRLVFGHRDSRAFDGAIEGLLDELGAPTRPHRGTVGPAFFDPVEAGEAVVVTTAASCRRRGVIARQLEPARTMPFAILHRDRDSSAVLTSFLTAARAATRRLSSRASPS